MGLGKGVERDGLGSKFVSTLTDRCCKYHV